jgi:hypothetical protein
MDCDVGGRLGDASRGYLDHPCRSVARMNRHTHPGQEERILSGTTVQLQHPLACPKSTPQDSPHDVALRAAN